jgi:hypothetical protein
MNLTLEKHKNSQLCLLLLYLLLLRIQYKLKDNLPYIPSLFRPPRKFWKFPDNPDLGGHREDHRYRDISDRLQTLGKQKSKIKSFGSVKICKTMFIKQIYCRKTLQLFFLWFLIKEKFSSSIFKFKRYN